MANLCFYFYGICHKSLHAMVSRFEPVLIAKVNGVHLSYLESWTHVVAIPQFRMGSVTTTLFRMTNFRRRANLENTGIYFKSANCTHEANRCKYECLYYGMYHESSHDLCRFAPALIRKNSHCTFILIKALETNFCDSIISYGLRNYNQAESTPNSLVSLRSLS